jgi:hypothetical protein
MRPGGRGGLRRPGSALLIYTAYTYETGTWKSPPPPPPTSTYVLYCLQGQNIYKLALPSNSTSSAIRESAAVPLVWCSGGREVQIGNIDTVVERYLDYCYARGRLSNFFCSQGARPHNRNFLRILRNHHSTD